MVRTKGGASQPHLPLIPATLFWQLALEHVWFYSKCLTGASLLLLMAVFQLGRKQMCMMLPKLMAQNWRLKYTKPLFLSSRIENDMYKVITASDMGTASIIPGKWSRHGLKKKKKDEESYEAKGSRDSVPNSYSSCFGNGVRRQGGLGCASTQGCCTLSDKLRESYVEINNDANIISEVQGCKLVHGDISEYNILYYEVTCNN